MAWGTMVAMSADAWISEGFASFRGHRTWDMRGRLPAIAAPALVPGGRDDPCAAPIQDGSDRVKGDSA